MFAERSWDCAYWDPWSAVYVRNIIFESEKESIKNVIRILNLYFDVNILPEDERESFETSCCMRCILFNKYFKFFVWEKPLFLFII